MKIGIDARMFGPKQGGLGRYLQQLILHLEQLENDSNEYVIFLSKENFNQYSPAEPQFIEKENNHPSIPCIEIQKNQRFKKVLADMKWYGWHEQMYLKKIITKEKIDLMHFPHFNVPFFYDDPFVVTIHDLIMYRYPRQQASTLGPIQYWFKDKAHRLIVKHAVSCALKIIVPSEFTKLEVAKILDVPLEKISVVSLAPAPLLVDSSDAVKSIKDKGPKKELYEMNVAKPYVLYVGNAYPHKNLDMLIKAWQTYSAKYGNERQLVLAGRKNFFYSRLINQHNVNENNDIIFIAEPTDQKLNILYENADLFVFPSLCEGFGLPPLEAMQYELPVISSNAACMPEILQDAALYFDPKSHEDIARALHIGLSDKTIRDRLNEKAKTILDKYNWHDTAGQTVQIYNSKKE
ncbi:MAG: glycosyltransferase family 1 protein [bacterium]